jgi:hypothetical protein
MIDNIKRYVWRWSFMEPRLRKIDSKKEIFANIEKQ